MPTTENGRDSQRCSENAPFRSALSCPFPKYYLVVSRVLDRVALLRACICQAPAKVPNSEIRFFGGSLGANFLICNCLLRHNTNCFFVDNMV